MTREEAIEVLENGGWWDLLIPITTIEGRVEEDKLHEALDLALSALRPVSRERVEKMYPKCKYCNEEWGTCAPITNRFTMPPKGGIRFCPMCGAPMTDEAVEMVMERMEALR